MISSAFFPIFFICVRVWVWTRKARLKCSLNNFLPISSFMFAIPPSLSFSRFVFSLSVSWVSSDMLHHRSSLPTMTRKSSHYTHCVMCVCVCFFSVTIIAVPNHLKCAFCADLHWTSWAHLCRSSSFMRFEHLFAEREIWITTLWSISSPFKIWTDIVSVRRFIFHFCSNFSGVCLFRYQRKIYELLVLYFIYLFLVIFNFHLSNVFLSLSLYRVVYADFNDLLDWLICDHLLNVCVYMYIYIFMCGIRTYLHTYVCTGARVYVCYRKFM